MVTVVFLVAAVLAVVSAVVAVSHRDPVFNVLSLVVTFFCVAVNYALLGADFLAAAQILVYAGAILVLFLFVIMLLGTPRTGSRATSARSRRVPAWRWRRSSRWGVPCSPLTRRIAPAADRAGRRHPGDRPAPDHDLRVCLRARSPCCSWPPWWAPWCW